jgi:hypothetical protein
MDLKGKRVVANAAADGHNGHGFCKKTVVATSMCQVNGNVKMSGWPAVKFRKPPLAIPYECF